MRYYFDLRDGAPVRDRCGQEFETPREAIAHAKNLAASMRMQDGKGKTDLRIRVVGDDSQMIHEEMVHDSNGRAGENLK